MEFIKGKNIEEKRSPPNLFISSEVQIVNTGSMGTPTLELLSEACSKCFLRTDPVVLTETACSE